MEVNKNAFISVVSPCCHTVTTISLSLVTPAELGWCHIGHVFNIFAKKYCIYTISTITIFKVLPCPKIPAEMGKDWSVKYANKTGYGE